MATVDPLLEAIPIVMETVVKVVMMLTLAAVAAAAADVNPNQFTCTAQSPVQAPQFSDTTPRVALTHIFCGQVKNGVAEGFHSRVLVNEAGTPCAKPTGDLQCANYEEMEDCKCSFSSEGVEVYDSNTGAYIKKTSNGGGPYDFFPDSWDAEQIVNVALEARQNGIKKKNDYCLKNVNIEGCDGPKINVQIYTDGTNIVSAFPVKKC